MPLLTVERVVKRFGGTVALDGVSIDVQPGQIHGVIGPNGAGKTTLFNVVNGIYSADGGTVTFKGQNITNRKVNVIAALGLGRTFQVARVFNEMSLLDNMIVPMVPKRISRRHAEERALQLLDVAGLTDLKDQVAIEISGGQKKLLEFVRTMMADPDLILLDEPFAGINPALVDRLSDIVLRLNRDQGKTFLLISHDIPSVMRLCETVVVLSAGRNIVIGKPTEVRHHEALIEAYFGR